MDSSLRPSISTSGTAMTVNDSTDVSGANKESSCEMKNFSSSNTDRSNGSLLYRLKRWLVLEPSKATKDEVSHSIRDYQAFTQPNYIYFLGGRFHTTRIVRPTFGEKGLKIPILPFTLLLTWFPFVLYLIYESSWLWHHVSPGLVIVMCYCWLVMEVCLIRVSFTDPGILPRNIHLLDQVKTKGLPEEYHSWIEMPGPVGRDGKETTVYAKYCTSCYTWRPVRASHCSRCNACIANLDHHCPWIGNCVGQRNYPQFVGFLVFAVLTCCILAATSFYMVAKRGIQATRMQCFLGVFCVIFNSYPFLLLIYHFLLGMTGITTREYLNVDRHQDNILLKDVCMNPFNSGNWLHNFHRECFRPRGVSTVRVISKRRRGDRRFERIVVGEV